MSQYHLTLYPTTAEAASFYSNGLPSAENAGFDLFVPEEVVFAPGERKLVSMRVKAKMECVSGGYGVSHYWMPPRSSNYWMPPRSSISKTGLLLLNSVGVIDKGYRGELMAFLWNTLDKEVVVKKGDRLVQIVAADMGWIQKVSVRPVEEIEQTERGEGGFGSTGR